MDGVNQPTFFRTNRPTREFQDDSDGTASMPELGRNQVTHVQCSALQQQMMAALVEVICLQIENGDPQKAKQLYKKVCQQLKRLKIMLPIANISEFSMVQHQCKKAIYSLICKTSDKLHRETRNRFLPGTLTEKVEAIFLQPNLRLTAQPSAVETFFFPNRYRDEFEHMEKIGKGAYGAVNKVKHKLDGVQYAIKLVKFPVRAEKVRKVTREVRHLSTLTHRHIVRYYGAWIENDFLPLICNDTEHVISHSGIEENIPALDEPMRLENIQQAQGLDIDRDQADMSEGSDSVQFKDSSQVTDLVPRIPPYSAAHLSINGESQHSENQASYNGESYSEDPTNQQMFTQTSTLYIQMELCETNLKDWLSDRNNRHAEDPFEVSKVEICHILKQILEAVEYIHSKDLIHRDLKPHNIFINQVGGSLDIKLGDFGLSRQIQASSFSVAATAPVTRSICRELLTPHPGAAEGFDWTLYTKGVGTTIYAAPEQLQGNDYSNKSDMYSLGLIAYELWCPFHTETERRICLSKIRTESLPQVFKEKWPSESEFIEKLLHKDPSVRPSARDLLNSQLFLTTDQIITNLCSELDKLKDENLSLKGQLRAKGEELQRKDLEIERLKLQVLSLDESVKQLKRDPR